MTMRISASSFLFNACQLRSEESTRDNYAADLQRSLQGELSSVELARQFFQSTYPTNGMKDICRAIFNRLRNGDASNEPSVYRLGSGFGGGKTHTLIALAGAARYPQLVLEGDTTVPVEYAPSQPVQLVTFTGENSDVERGALVPGAGDIRARSLIGQMSWQLGGEAAFNEFKTYDENLSSPGSEDIRRLLGQDPCLILIDELVQWLDRMNELRFSAVLPNVRTLFSSLAQAVETCPNAVLVITTPDPASDAYREATQLTLDILGNVDSVLARTAHQTIPSETPDLPAILRRRLFSRVDEAARSEVSAAYADLCQRSSALIAPPPQDRTPLQWFTENYPLHPDTLRIIVERIASNDNFQKTRGILRLLGMTTHYLRNSASGEGTLLIHPHHIDPDNTEIHAQLTTRIERGEFDSAIVADITGPESTATRIDETRPTRPARRLSRAALLASLAPISSARGITPSELTRAVITPFDEDSSVVANAITEFRNSALYVNDDPGVTSIQFTTVPNLNRMLLERRNGLTAAEIDQQIKQAVTDCFTMPRQQSQRHMRAAVFPSGSDIPDNPDSVGLGAINYEWFTQGDQSRMQALSNFYRNSPAGGGQSPRQYKNNLVILVADNDHIGDMERHARRCLAARQIKNSPPETLQPYQFKSLEAELAGAVKDLFIAIQKLYVNLYYPSTDHPISNDTLMHHVVISPEVAVDKPGDGQHAIVETLAARRKLITFETADLDPESYWKRRRNLMQGKVNLVSLKEEFAREPGNYMLLNNTVADNILKKALDREAITIQTGAGQTITRGNELLRTDDPEAMVYLRDNACPDCHRYREDCQCGKEQPQLCPLCGKEQHAGQCGGTQPPPPSPGGIPPFSSGLEPQPLNVLVMDLRRYMEQHKVTSADIGAVTLGSDKAEFINQLASLLGQNCKATVSYQLRRGEDFSIAVNGMDITEWSSVMSRIAPMLERIKDSSTMGASVTINGDDNSPEQIDSILDQLPGSHVAGMESTFKQKPGE